MAPKQARQNFCGSFDHIRFVSADVMAIRANSLVNKIAIPKQRLDQGLITHVDLQPMINEHHWQNFCALPAVGIIPLVREFYANIVEATNDLILCKVNWFHSRALPSINFMKLLILKSMAMVNT